MKALLVYGNGGHTAQMIRLARDLPIDWVYEYAIGIGDNLTESKLDQEPYPIPVPTVSIKKPLRTLLTLPWALATACALLVITRPDVVITAGAGVAVPVCYVARLFGAKVVFIESWSRVNEKSLSGRFVYPVANQFFVQHEEMVKLYPNAVFVGRLG